MSQSTTVSAPGSIMITGEHAVVYGHPAIVCAIEQRITVTLTPLSTETVVIESEIASTVQQDLGELQPDGPMRFVLHAVALYRAHLKNGIKLSIRSQIDPTLGLGSSAAVTAACLGALNAFCGTDKSPAMLHLEALTVIRHIQGRGSGADLAASIFGGVLSYQLPDPLLAGVPAKDASFAQVSPLPALPPLGLCYVGYKTPTGDVLAKIAEDMQGHEAAYDRLYQNMGSCAANATDAARQKDWTAFASALNAYQSLMVRLGVSDPQLERIVQNATEADAAKISGSGLGDCVLSLGALPKGFVSVTQAQDGLIIHD